MKKIEMPMNAIDNVLKDKGRGSSFFVRSSKNQTNQTNQKSNKGIPQTSIQPPLNDSYDYFMDDPITFTNELYEG